MIQFNIFAFMCGIFVGSIIFAIISNGGIKWLDFKYFVLECYDWVCAKVCTLIRKVKSWI